MPDHIDLSRFCETPAGAGCYSHCYRTEQLCLAWTALCKSGPLQLFHIWVTSSSATSLSEWLPGGKVTEAHCAEFVIPDLCRSRLLRALWRSASPTAQPKHCQSSPSSGEKCNHGALRWHIHSLQCVYEKRDCWLSYPVVLKVAKLLLLCCKCATWLHQNFSSIAN